MKSYFSFIPREGENLSPVLCRTIIYELRELLSSESKALIAISGAPKPSLREQCFSAKYYFYRIPNQLDLCDFSSGHKGSKRSGSFWHSRKKQRHGNIKILEKAKKSTKGNLFFNVMHSRNSPVNCSGKSCEGIKHPADISKKGKLPFNLLVRWGFQLAAELTQYQVLWVKGLINKPKCAVASELLLRHNL